MELRQGREERREAGQRHRDQRKEKCKGRERGKRDLRGQRSCRTIGNKWRDRVFRVNAYIPVRFFFLIGAEKLLLERLLSTLCVYFF